MHLANVAYWTVSQIGAREHYAAARSLLRMQRRCLLITDYWCRRTGSWCALPRMRQRHSADIPASAVRAFNVQTVLGECLRKARLHGWERIEARNRWFGSASARALAPADGRACVFAYSYAALELLQRARSLGHKTILGQIDPGPVEQEIVCNIHRRHRLADPALPSPEYWDRWRSECAIADSILVNSEWSRDALMREGVPEEKLVVVPLAYECQTVHPRVARSVSRFSSDRPLDVLLLGQVIPRKGLLEVAEAAHILRGSPVRWSIVGNGDAYVLDSLRRAPGVTVYGPATREEVSQFYRKADVFMLPTHSDGFALTQLEAAAHGLPIIASQFCGNVVTHDSNGLILRQVTADAIAALIERLLSEQELYSRLVFGMSEYKVPDLGSFGRALTRLE